MRIIYSIYVEIPKNKWDVTDRGYLRDNLSKSERSFLSFTKYYKDLIKCKKRYSEKCNSEYIVFGYDDAYVKFSDKMREILPTISEYNIINFYKFDRLEYLSQKYDEILFLDFDVIPLTDENYFDVWKDKFSIATSPLINTKMNQYFDIKYNLDFRSPEAKMINSILLGQEYGLDDNLPAFNTGIMGATSDLIKQLNYFDDFKNVIEILNEIKEEEILPETWKSGMGWDNETIFGFRTKQKDLPWAEIGDKWHSIIDLTFSPSAKLAHFINKRFDWIFETEWKDYFDNTRS